MTRRPNKARIIRGPKASSCASYQWSRPVYRDHKVRAALLQARRSSRDLRQSSSPPAKKSSPGCQAGVGRIAEVVVAAVASMAQLPASLRERRFSMRAVEARGAAERELPEASLPRPEFRHGLLKMRRRRLRPLDVFCHRRSPRPRYAPLVRHQIEVRLHRGQGDFSSCAMKLKSSVRRRGALRF